MAKPELPAVRGRAAGVPFLAAPPARPRGDAPVVLLWHLLDAPRTPEALAGALPLADVDAWRVYLGLPMTGERLPDGGWPEIVRRASEDAVMLVHEPISRQAAEELPTVLEALAGELEWTDPRPPLALVGGSLGSVVAQRALLDTLAPAGFGVDALVLLSPVCELRAMIAAAARRFSMQYAWHAAAQAVARHLDFVARAPEFAAVGGPALRLLAGERDDRDGFIEPSLRLAEALRALYGDPNRVDVAIVDGMGHALAEEPGTDPAPQTPDAVRVDRLASDWLRRHLRRANFAL